MWVVKKCEICSAPATVFLTQIINGKSTKFCLCAKCALERGLLDPDACDLAEKLFPNLQGQYGKEGAAGPAVPIPALQSLPLTSCPIWSFTLQDYKNVGRLGCSECYNVFEEEILPLLTQIQPDSHHHGKTPERAEKRETETHTISDLEQQLSLAVAREDYERAAKLRDQIKQLRTPTN